VSAKGGNSESPRNFGHVCSEHAPKPGKFAGQDPKTFLGKFVKLGFKTKDGTNTEHMWVKVDKVNKINKSGELEGVLDNDPVLDVGYAHGDALAFEVSEIEAVDG